MQKPKVSILISLSCLFMTMTSALGETDQNEVRNNIASGWEQVFWGPVFNEEDYLHILLAVARSIDESDSAPIEQYFDQQLDEILTTMENAYVRN